MVVARQQACDIILTLRGLYFSKNGIAPDAVGHFWIPAVRTFACVQSSLAAEAVSQTADITFPIQPSCDLSKSLHIVCGS